MAFKAVELDKVIQEAKTEEAISTFGEQMETEEPPEKTEETIRQKKTRVRCYGIQEKRIDPEINTALNCAECC